MLVISISTTSPSFKNRLGDLKTPTPAGVPVMTAVYAGIVVPVVQITLSVSSKAEVDLSDTAKTDFDS